MVNQNFSSDTPIWVLLAELSLRDFLSVYDQREDNSAGLLLPMARKMGISPECMDNIGKTLAGFAKEALARSKQGRLEFSGQIRIFCQKKIIDDANLVKSSRPPEQDKEQKQVFPDSSVSKVGGWGYFMIEPSEDLLPYSAAVPQSYIGLYLYKEGE